MGQPIKLKTSSLVLRSASPYFARMMSNNMKEANEMMVDIYAEKVEDVKSVLFFLFLNKFHVSEPRRVIVLAHLFQIKTLFECCREEMIKSVTVENFVETVEVMLRYEVQDGMKILISFGQDNLEGLKSLALDKGYLDLPFSFRFMLENWVDRVNYDEIIKVVEDRRSQEEQSRWQEIIAM